jgi:hypothetical protein
MSTAIRRNPQAIPRVAAEGAAARSVDAGAMDPNTSESPVGAALLPVFAIATVIATIAICVVVAAASTVAVVVALGTVIGFAAAIVVLLGRLIGPQDH